MHPFIPPAVPASTVAPLPEPWEEKPYLLPLSRSLCPALYTPSVSFRISHSLSRKKKTERRRERHINLIKRVLLLAVGRHFLWQYRWQHCECLCVVCVCVSPAEGSIRWPKPWFVNQSAVQGHSVLWGSAECRYTCVCGVSVCVDSVLCLCFEMQRAIDLPRSKTASSFTQSVLASLSIYTAVPTLCVCLCEYYNIMFLRPKASTSLSPSNLSPFCFFFFRGNREELNRIKS